MRNGFKQYDGVLGIKYVSSDYVEPVQDVRDKHDEILDLIFTRHPNTGFPTGSYQMFLSEKTSAEVRQFIQDYLMGVNQEKGLSFDDDVLSEFNKLPSDFIAQTARKHSESVEQYEARLTEYVRQLRQEETFKERLARYQKEYADK